MLTVSSPRNLTVATRVYEPIVEVRDHLGVPISGASLTLTEVNGTTLRATTDFYGEALFPPIPHGGFTATVTSLGMPTRFAGDASVVPVTVVVIPWSYTEIGLVTVALVVSVIILFVVSRRRH
jgi:hypothetical protein